MSDREHGTHNCYVHGPDRRFSGRGCRCEPCRVAHSAYEKERARRVAPPYVLATGTRTHVRELMAAGVGLKTIAKRSGVAHGALSKLIYGDPARGMGPSKRIRPETRDRILAVHANDQADGAKIPAALTWQHIDTLLERGWTKAAISEAIGQGGRSLQIGRHEVTARNARAIRLLLHQPVPARRSRWGVHEIDADDQANEIDVTAHEEIDRYELPTLPVGLGAWIARAQCRRDDAPTHLFFPERGDGETLAAAKAICATCTVRDDCLTYALDNDEPGIWGGTSEKQRRHIRRQQLGATA